MPIGVHAKDGVDNEMTKCAKNPRVAIDVIELLQSRDGERDEVTAPGMLLKRNIRDDKMNQRVGGDDKEHYDRSEPSTKLEKTRSVCGKSFTHLRGIVNRTISN
ncbi:hypothetical protein YC2023_004876 [Brassica napus]